jgi:hypothetical protein
MAVGPIKTCLYLMVFHPENNYYKSMNINLLFILLLVITVVTLIPAPRVQRF